ncbi:cytochrome c oxidase subunit 1 [Methylobacterium sp. ap11]|uniref:cytochrome c oxidase subunit I n=1 Tax=Methylobacterium sp. ap11 TaxID=1761799 RepID=UPI0008B7C346|nr:cbb3-type cytochrome c oxidase subunit I [Methylobacterium sp. ap11]SEP19617.1 cytochrome c oxidase subunit 1 [Methylobacterium sp. ap11]
MTSGTVTDGAALREPHTPDSRLGHGADYLHAEHTLRSWFFTTDHKRIALLYLASITGFFVIGAVTAGLVRLALVVPNGQVFTNDTYNKLFTIHGVVMVWFFLIPSIPATFGNFLIPLMIGARDLAFPKLNLASWYVFMTGAFFTLVSVVLGGVDTGWTFYTPLSTAFSNTWVVPALIGVTIVGFSSILTGLNFVVTIHTMRAPGMTWFRLPIFVWTHYATSLIFLLATPVITVALILLIAERAFHIGVFDPAYGGDPVLFQHLFWFYSHPAVYIMVLPGMGVISEIVPAFAQKKLFGYKFVAYAAIGLASVTFFVWGHHMFVNGQSDFASVAFSVLSFAVAVPSAVKVYNWTATIHKGSLKLDTPMLYAMGYIGLFVLGGLTGLYLATLAINQHVHATYFVVAHFHYIMVGGTVLAFLGGLHFWWPKITGRMYIEAWGRISAFLIFIGFNVTFFPQFILGYLGMPRRYHVYPPEFQFLNILSSAGSTILAVGYIFPMVYLVYSIWFGKRAQANPWDARGLEWTVPSPPPAHNFLTEPVAPKVPYDYPIQARETGRQHS